MKNGVPSYVPNYVPVACSSLVCTSELLRVATSHHSLMQGDPSSTSGLGIAYVMVGIAINMG